MLVTEQTVTIVLKIFFLIAFFIYIVFAAVATRQVQLMTKTVEVGLETQIKAIAWVHLFIAVGIFLVALIVL